MKSRAIGEIYLEIGRPDGLQQSNSRNNKHQQIATLDEACKRSMTIHGSLSKLSVDLLFIIFALLDRPSKLALALSSPRLLHLLAKYYDLDRYRHEPLFIQKMDIPDSVSWDDSRAQGAIIRWIAMPGSDDIDSPPPVGEVAEEEEVGLDYKGDMDEERFKPYEETQAGKEEVVVQKIIENWLKKRYRIEGSIIFCAECYRFMRLHPENGKKPWCAKMVTRSL